MAIKHTGQGTFIDTDPVENPRDHIYSYATFRSLEHVSFGLYRTTGGPTASEVDSEEVGQYGMEPLASHWEFKYALEEVGERGAFEVRMERRAW